VVVGRLIMGAGTAAGGFGFLLGPGGGVVPAVVALAVVTAPVALAVVTAPVALAVVTALAAEA
jgi:hypothetical protein